MKIRILAAVVLSVSLFSCGEEPRQAGVFEIEILDEHPRMVLTRTELEEVRKNVESGEQPWKYEWEILQGKADGYLAESWQPLPYYGDNSMDYYQALMRDAGAARDLGLSYYISGNEAYAQKGAAIIDAWLPDGELPGMYFDPEVNYPNLGMLVGRSAFPFLYGYDLLKGAGFISERTQARLLEWLPSRVEFIKEGARRWHDNNYFDQQWYQNHIVAETMGLMAIAITTGDEALLQYAVDSPENQRDVKEIVEGLILMEGQPAYYREPGDWPTQTGEIADRYRHFEIGGHYRDYKTKPNRGLQYCGLSTTLLTAIAEMGRHNGIDVYGYTAPTGENLVLPYLFYSDFYITHDASVKGGYYTGEDAWINGGETNTWALWEVGNTRYPGNEKIRQVLEVNRGEPVSSVHLIGPVALTHAVKIP